MLPKTDMFEIGRTKEDIKMDTLELALSLELDLEIYYREQAERNKENSLHVVFSMLAKEEENHAKILRSKADLLTTPVQETNILVEVRKLFKQLGNFKSDIKDIPSQLDSYRMALEMEQRSLKFYRTLRDNSQEEKAKATYQYLIKQEDIHCAIMDELVKLTTRPEEWVESAEFGLREDY